ncbi:MAG: DUF1854 domain-containing protein [Patescibacteria group bacterium]|nr:DUF1854 domain-containing protein [Patescibacteria group bacterium]
MEQEDTTRNQDAAGALGLQRDGQGHLVMAGGDGEPVTIVPVRLFPLSDPDQWISLVDQAGRELVCLETLEYLSSQARQLLEEELAQREFLPIIRRIERVSAHEDPSRWHVLTDRGETSFLVNHEDEVNRLGTHSAVIIDSHSIRYLIPDLRLLDPASRRILDRYV